MYLGKVHVSSKTGAGNGNLMVMKISSIVTLFDDNVNLDDDDDDGDDDDGDTGGSDGDDAGGDGDSDSEK